MIEEKIRENLLDADCDEIFINEFICMFNKGNYPQMNMMLKKQRFKLLDSIHIEQKKLDCLDYMIVNIRRRAEKNEKLQ